MIEPTFPYVFALNGKSSRSSGGEVLAFWNDKIELLHRGEILKSWPYGELQQLTYSPKKGGTGIWSMLVGGLGKRTEDEWTVQTATETLWFQLEMDSKYRKAELQQLSDFLQKHVSVFQEETKH